MRIIVLTLAFVFSAVAAQAGSITLYKGEAFQGESWNINHAVRNFSDNAGWNDTVMSAIIHDGLWEACVDANYQNCFILQGNDVRDFHRIGLDRKISSIREVDARNYGGYDDGPVLGRRDRERFADRYDDRDGQRYSNYHQGYGRQKIIWNSPIRANSYLSPCQSEVQDAINQRSGHQCQLSFRGTSNRGQAMESSGEIYNYMCRGNQINIW
jgi:hypothetical protein